jgi:hypothetical protein
MRQFIDHEAMIKASEIAVREEAKRHPDSPWRMQPGDTHEFAEAVADARKRLRNELLAERIEQVVKAANTRDRYEAEGHPVPLWARNTLAWASEPQRITELYQFDEEDDGDVEGAIAALSAALR